MACCPETQSSELGLGHLVCLPGDTVSSALVPASLAEVTIPEQKPTKGKGLKSGNKEKRSTLLETEVGEAGEAGEAGGHSWHPPRSTPVLSAATWDSHVQTWNSACWGRSKGSLLSRFGVPPLTLLGH